MNKNYKATNQDINHLLTRGVAEIIIREELITLLQSNKKLRLKEGFDPSFPDIHLGHMVALKKLRQFQELGHQVILIVGDWTAQIGDPSGASVTRPMLSAKQVQDNAETYMKQFFRVVDRKRTEVRWQSEWFGKFTLSDIIRLTSNFTVAQLLTRDDFSKRYGNNQPIAVTELLYPLLQAYDSVAIRADVEFGGTDQKFNFLMGRELQVKKGQRPQQCFMTPLLVGTDGSQKMSKSLGNYIGVDEPPSEIYGKVMSIPDNLILQYFDLVTDVPNLELEEFRQNLNQKTVNPMILKKRLASEVVTQLYDQNIAKEADGHFTKVIQNKKVPDEIPSHPISFGKFKIPSTTDYLKTTALFDISRILVEINLAGSRSESNRLIKQGAVSVDGQGLHDNTLSRKFSGYAYPLHSGSIIRVGKRYFVRITNTDKMK